MNTLPDSPCAPASPACAGPGSRAAAQAGQPSHALRDLGFLALLLQHIAEEFETAAPPPDLPPLEAVFEKAQNESISPDGNDAGRSDPSLPILPLQAYPPPGEAPLSEAFASGAGPAGDVTPAPAQSLSAGILTELRQAAPDFPGASPIPALTPAFAASPKSTANFAPDGKIFPFTAADTVASLPARPHSPAESVLHGQPLPGENAPFAAWLHAPSLPFAAGASPAPPGIHAPLGASGWHTEFAQHVVWMAIHQHQTAELRLNPPHLGPVEIVLTLNHDQGLEASVQFASSHAAVREAIEASLPRLKELFAESGITMGHVTVSAESFRDRKQGEGRDDGTSGSAGAAAGLAAIHRQPDAPRSVLPIYRGLVDTFA